MTLHSLKGNTAKEIENTSEDLIQDNAVFGFNCFC